MSPKSYFILILNSINCVRPYRQRIQAGVLRENDGDGGLNGIFLLSSRRASFIPVDHRSPVEYGQIDREVVRLILYILLTRHVADYD
jgi:hypothetical protein